MKKLFALLIAAMLCVSCISKQVTDNQHVYDHAPFPNYNMSVFGFGAFSVTIDKSFKLVESKREGDIEYYNYFDEKYPHLAVNVVFVKNNAPYDMTFSKEDVVYFKKNHTTVLVYRDINMHRVFGVSILKFRNLGDGRKLYVEYKTGRDGQDYTEKDANHLIALFDNSVKMVSDGRINISMPPCPFNHN